MENIKITTQESEAVERAYYEAQSYEALMAILSRQLNAGANTMIADMLHYYAGLCRKAQMKLKSGAGQGVGAVHRPGRKPEPDRAL